jgi:hypothetical protein
MLSTGKRVGPASLNQPGKGLFRGTGVKVEGIRPDIHKDRLGPQISDHFSGGGKGIRRKEDYIPGPYSAGFKGEVQTAGRGVHGQRGKTGLPEKGPEFRFKRRGFPGRGKPA